MILNRDIYKAMIHQKKHKSSLSFMEDVKKINSDSNGRFNNNEPGICYSDRRIATAAALIIIILARRRRRCLKGKKIKKFKRKRKSSQIIQVEHPSKEVNKADVLSSSTVQTENHLMPKQASSIIAPDNLQKELSLKDAEMYRHCLRMDTNSFYELYNLIKPLVQRKDTVMRECISTTDRLAITLRYLALGETQKALASEFKIAQNTISGIIPDVCQALCSVLEEGYLKTPLSAEEWKDIAHAFGRNWSYPWCIGALDGRTVKMTSYPRLDPANSKNKVDHPVSLITLVNADYKFIFADVGVYGHLYQDGQWEKTSLGSLVENNGMSIPPPVSFIGCQKFVPFVFIANDPFPLRSYIMKPYPSVGEFVDDAKRVFNYRVSRPQRVSDNTYGILMNRFQIYRHPLRANFDKGRDVIMATICLHNFLMSGSSRYSYCPPELTDMEDVVSGMFYPGQWRESASNVAGISPLQQGPVANSIYAEDVRNTFCHYFCSASQMMRE